MIIKMFWERCPEFIMEEEDAFIIEASKEETYDKILPLLSPHEMLKFEQMKDIYVSKSSEGGTCEGCYYFLVSRGAGAVKFDSAAILSADLSKRGGKTRVFPNIAISGIEDIDGIDPDRY